MLGRNHLIHLQLTTKTDKTRAISIMSKRMKTNTYGFYNYPQMKFYRKLTLINGKKKEKEKTISIGHQNPNKKN